MFVRRRVGSIVEGCRHVHLEFALRCYLQTVGQPGLESIRSHAGRIRCESGISTEPHALGIPSPLQIHEAITYIMQHKSYATRKQSRALRRRHSTSKALNPGRGKYCDDERKLPVQLLSAQLTAESWPQVAIESSSILPKGPQLSIYLPELRHPKAFPRETRHASARTLTPSHRGLLDRAIRPQVSRLMYLNISDNRPADRLSEYRVYSIEYRV